MIDINYEDEYGYQWEWQPIDQQFPALQGTLLSMQQQFIEIYGQIDPNSQDDGEGYDLKQVYKGFSDYDVIYYSGEWKDGHRHGKGKELKQRTKEDQQQPQQIRYYEGSYQQDRWNGQGYEINDINYVYRGYYKNSQKYGYGEQFMGNKSKYVGQWQANTVDGYGYYIDMKNNKYMGWFGHGMKQGQGSMVFVDGSKFKGGFYQDCQQGRGQFVDKNGRVIKGVWLYGQLQQQGQQSQESGFKAVNRAIKEKIEQINGWISQSKYVQMVFQLGQFGDHNDYQLLVRSDGSDYVHRVFYRIYFGFGMILRPLFIDFVGPFVAFIEYFWLIKGDGDLKCGGIRSFELSIVNYSFLVLVNIGQIVLIVLMIIKYRSQFRKQKQCFQENADLKAKIAVNEYRNKYGGMDFDFDIQKIDKKQLEQQNRNDGIEDRNGQQVQLVFDRQISQYQYDGQKMKYMLEKQKTSSTKLYNQLMMINSKQLKHDFDYFRSFNDLKYISSSLTLDLDLLSDSMAVANCYVLSQCMNLSQEIRDDLGLYYKLSLAVLLVSILPKLNCYLFLLVRLIVAKLAIIKYKQHYSWQWNEQPDSDGQVRKQFKATNEQLQEKLVVEKNSCFKKFMLQFYRIVSKFYGINYKRNKDCSDEYVLVSKDYQQDIKRLFYVNHEDMFTAEQFNPAKQTVDLLDYDEMGRQTHSLLKMNTFRTFFENVPQLGLQVMMVYSLQQSDVEDCKQTDFTFYQSIITTVLNMVLGLVNVLQTVLKKILDGDLVVQNMKLQFDKYLQENKIRNGTDKFIIDDKIQFYPKMIESIYQFLLQNNKYKQIQFGKQVLFRGKIKEYIKVIEFAKGQDQLSQIVKLVFENENKSKEQIIAEMVMKKIFEELVIMDCKIEYNKQNRFIISHRKGYQYEYGTNMKGWIELLESGMLEVKIDVMQSQLILRHCSVDEIQRIGRSLQVVVENQVFDIGLFEKLVEMKRRISAVHFEVENRRVKEMIEKYRATICKIKMVSRWGRYTNWYQKCLAVKDQLDGLQVEIDKIEYENEFYMYFVHYVFVNQQDQEILKNVFSFRHGLIEIRETERTSFEENLDMMKYFVGYGVGQLRNSLFRLNQFYNKEGLATIKQMKDSNPELRISHWLDHDKECRQQELGGKQGMIKFKDFIKLEQISINEMEFVVQSGLENIDQGFEMYIDEDECIDIFGKLDRIIVWLGQQDMQKVIEMSEKQRNSRSKYQIKSVQINSNIRSPSFDEVVSIIDWVYPFYDGLQRVELMIGVDQQLRDVLFKLVRQKYPGLEIRSSGLEG